MDIVSFTYEPEYCWEHASSPMPRLWKTHTHTQGKSKAQSAADYITLPAMRCISLLVKTMRWAGGGSENNKILWDSWAWKPFYVSHFLVGRMFQPPLPFLSSKGQMLRIMAAVRKGEDEETGGGAAEKK